MRGIRIVHHLPICNSQTKRSVDFSRGVSFRRDPTCSEKFDPCLEDLKRITFSCHASWRWRSSKMPGPKRTKKRGSGCRFRPEIQGAAVDGGRKATGFTRVLYISGGAGLDCHQQKYLSSTWICEGWKCHQIHHHLVRKCVELFPTSEVLHIFNDSESIYPVQCREADPIERETIVLRGDLLC